MVVKAAVVGAGFFGSLHAKVYSDYERSELVCVCDTNLESAKKLASKFGCRYTDNIQEILSDKNIDVVSVVTPDHAHKKPALEVLKAKKPMLIEKPLTVDVAEGQEILEAARKAKVKTMVDFTNRWNPPFAEAKKEIERGRIGKPIMAYARLSLPISSPLDMYPNWCSNSGPEWYLLPHIADIVRWLLERDPTAVFALAVDSVLRSKGFQCYDAVQVEAEFEGVPVALEASWVMPRSLPSGLDFRVEIHGTTGHIAICANVSGIAIATSEQYREPVLSQLQEVHGHQVGFLTGPIRHFVDCVADDMEPMVSLSDGLVVTKFIVAVRNSIKQNTMIAIN